LFSRAIGKVAKPSSLWEMKGKEGLATLGKVTEENGFLAFFLALPS